MNDHTSGAGIERLPVSGWRRLVRIARFAVARSLQDQIIEVAASLTFTTVLSIVPLLAVALSLFTAFPLFKDYRDALQDFLATNLMPSAVSDTVMQYLNDFAHQASRLTAIGSGFLVITALLLIMSIDSALNNIWHLKRQRPISQRILVYWAVVSLGPVMLGASLWASTHLARESLGMVAQIPILDELGISAVPFALTILGFTAIFVVVPNCKVLWRDAFAGGVLTAVILEAMKIGFAFYISQFPTYTIIYGTFAAVPVFLAWIYISWIGVLLGATLAANLPLIRSNRMYTVARPGSDLVDAITLLDALENARKNKPPGLTVSELDGCTEIQHESLMRLLNTLASLGLIAATQTTRADRWMMVCDVRTAKFGPLFDRLAIDRSHCGLQHNPRLANAIVELVQGNNAPTIENVLSPHDSAQDQPLQ